MTIWVRSEDKSDFARMTIGGVSSDDKWDKDSGLALWLSGVSQDDNSDLARLDLMMIEG